jgi:cullin-associated NEDD8-dissociated protein 1
LFGYLLRAPICFQVRTHASEFTGKTFEPVLAELPALLSDGDLHVAQLTLTLLASVARRRPDALPVVATTSLPEVLRLTRSPLLQGAALAATIDLFRAFVEAGAPDLGQKRLVETLVGPVLSAEGAAIHKQVYPRPA